MNQRTFNRVMACLTVALIWFLMIAAATAQAVDRIPSRAYQYQKTIHAEVRRQWGLNLPENAISIAAATIHQESAWNPRAQSAYAKGLTQFTDPTWADMIRLDPSIVTLGDIWNPHAAIRALARYHRLLWTQFSDIPPQDRWPFLLSGYNGGPGWVRRDQSLCRMDPGCKPHLWWGNVERYSRRADWAIKENREYVKRIMGRWMPLYQTF